MSGDFFLNLKVVLRMLKLTLVMLAIIAASQCGSIPKTAAPVQLLNLASGNKSDVLYNEAAVKNLFMDPKLADRDVVVFSIIGAFRKGKSFLMNYILRYMYANFKSVLNSNLVNAEDWLGDEDEPLTGFDWKSGTQRITTGLILWSDVFLYDGPKGDRFAIYLMDTQGLFDHKTSSVDNSRIFSLSTMISSIQILNLHNIIQENQLQYLQFATEYARYASGDEEKKPFQNLMILIRDWNSPDEYRDGLRGGNAYLNSFLEIHDHQTKELQSVRRYLRSSFERIDCFLMPHPGKTVARDSTYTGRWGDIDDDFIQGMKDMFHFLFSPKNLKAKHINGELVKPAELLVFINEYVENFKNDSMPEATNIYHSTLDKQFSMLTGKSVDVYVNAVASHNQELQSEDDVDKLHAAAKNKALKYFDSQRKFGSYSEAANFKRELQQKIEGTYQQWKQVSMNHIRILQQQKTKTIEKENQVKLAQVMDDKARADMEQAVKNAAEANRALAKARFDTEEARREAEELRLKSIAAEKERSAAIEKENQTREWLDKMTSEKEFFEQQYKEYKSNANANVGNTLRASQESNGFTSVLGQVSSFFSAAVPFISAIGGLFG